MRKQTSRGRPCRRPAGAGSHLMLALMAWHASACWAASVPTTATFAVNAGVVKGCVVSGSPSQTTGIAFGSINFGTHSAVQSGTVTAMAGSSMGAQAMLQCTPGTSVQIVVNGGLHLQGSQRRLASAAGMFVPYTLWLVAGTTSPLTPNTPASMTLGTTATALPVRGMATLPGSGIAAGTYTDTVQVTLSW